MPGASMGSKPPARGGRPREDFHRLAHEVGGHRSEALGLALGPAIFEHHVPAFHMTELAQAIREGHDDVGARRWASSVISSPTRRAVPGVWA